MNPYMNPYQYPPGYSSFYPVYFPVPNVRQFPPVDVEGLTYSARRFQKLMEQAGRLINTINRSHQFAFDLMNAAQMSDEKRVNELIRSTGITTKMQTKFTPSGIQITLDNSEMEGGCCKLLIALRW